jgi:hypothetical protein
MSLVAMPYSKGASAQAWPQESGYESHGVLAGNNRKVSPKCWRTGHGLQRSRASGEKSGKSRISREAYVRPRSAVVDGVLPRSCSGRRIGQSGILEGGGDFLDHADLASMVVSGTAVLFRRFGGVCGSAGQRVAPRTTAGALWLFRMVIRGGVQPPASPSHPT